MESIFISLNLALNAVIVFFFYKRFGEFLKKFSEFSNRDNQESYRASFYKEQMITTKEYNDSLTNQIKQRGDTIEENRIEIQRLKNRITEYSNAISEKNDILEKLKEENKNIISQSDIDRKFLIHENEKLKIQVELLSKSLYNKEGQR